MKFMLPTTAWNEAGRKAGVQNPLELAKNSIAIADYHFILAHLICAMGVFVLLSVLGSAGITPRVETGALFLVVVVAMAVGCANRYGAFSGEMPLRKMFCYTDQDIDVMAQQLRGIQEAN